MLRYVQLTTPSTQGKIKLLLSACQSGDFSPLLEYVRLLDSADTRPLSSIDGHCGVSNL